MRAHGSVLSMCSCSFLGDRASSLSRRSVFLCPANLCPDPIVVCSNVRGVLAIFGGSAGHSPLIGPSCGSGSVPFGSAWRMPPHGFARSDCAWSHGIFALPFFTRRFRGSFLVRIGFLSRIRLVSFLCDVSPELFRRKTKGSQLPVWITFGG